MRWRIASCRVLGFWQVTREKDVSKVPAWVEGQISCGSLAVEKGPSPPHRRRDVGRCDRCNCRSRLHSRTRAKRGEQTPQAVLQWADRSPPSLAIFKEANVHVGLDPVRYKVEHQPTYRAGPHVRPSPRSRPLGHSMVSVGFGWCFVNGKSMAKAATAAN